MWKKAPKPDPQRPYAGARVKLCGKRPPNRTPKDLTLVLVLNYMEKAPKLDHEKRPTPALVLNYVGKAPKLDPQRPYTGVGVKLCECVMNAKAVEDFHAQISNVASTLLDEFRLAFHYRYVYSTLEHTVLKKLKLSNL